MIKSLFRSKLTLSVFLLLQCTSTFAAVGPSIQDVEAKFSKILKNTKVTSVKSTPITGVYEIIAGPNVFYFSPDGNGHLIFGNIVDSTGKNLTAEVQLLHKEEFQKERERQQKERAGSLQKKIADVDLTQAIKIGTGPNVVVEFTDPDCPFCRKVDNFLSARSDVTRYIFLFPLDMHPDAKAKSLFIYSSSDRDKALREVFSGRYDTGRVPMNNNIATAQASDKLLATSIKIGRDLGVQGTPMLLVNGQLVDGADLAKIGSLLKQIP